MNYDLFVKNELLKARNKEKYKHLKDYINNIKAYMGSELQNRVINNMILASMFYDREHRTNTHKILARYIRRYCND